MLARAAWIIALLGVACDKRAPSADRAVGSGSGTVAVAPPVVADASTRSPFLPPYADVARIEISAGIANGSGSVCDRIDTKLDLDVGTGRWSAKHCVLDKLALEARSGVLPPTTQLAALYDRLKLYERKGRGCSGSDGAPLSVTVYARNGTSVTFDNEFDFPDCNAKFGVRDEVDDWISELRTATKLDSLGTQAFEHHSPFLPAFKDVATIEIVEGIARNRPTICDRIERQVVFDVAAGTWTGKRCQGNSLVDASGKLGNYAIDLLQNSYSIVTVEQHAEPGCTGDTRRGQPVTVTVRVRDGTSVTFDNGVAPPCAPGLRVKEGELWPLTERLDSIAHLKGLPPR